MKVNIAFAVQTLACLCTALAQNEVNSANGATAEPDYDVVVVGGGYAGLAAASSLGRVRRTVLLVDSAEYRNNYTRRVHDVLGFDGVTPAWIRFRAREQIMEYPTIHFTNGTVDAIQSQGSSSATLFSISARIGDDKKPTTVTARKVVIATGLRDIIPNTPGLADCWGQGVWWCPFCDGYEHVDQPIGVLGGLDVSANTPLEILSQNKDIILFVNGTDTPENRAIADRKLPHWDKWLQINNIKVDNRSITSFERLKDGGAVKGDPSRATSPEYDLFRLHFSTGEPVERAGFITNFKNEQRSMVGANAGVTLYGGRLQANDSKGMETNVPGIYAVGDANTDNSTNVYHAMWSGKRAAVSLHVRIETENAQAEVSNGPGKRDNYAVEDERSLWRRVNGPDDVLKVGEYDRW
ncbi:thioredoxin reductase like protein [Zymoseptoria brevis]|uniref:Thioredoxin reductase like protein n=1 Tax=Zymoseptoria brevis TaxID=1047168 RepID=A0A0F4GAW2_9PEZI|nr:thioredoxin reductase like protein [Zymoseptoria brevis]